MCKKRSIKSKPLAILKKTNGGIAMNMLTKKEAEYVAELMTIEENLCKKSALYSRVLTDIKLASALREVSELSRQRFIELYKSLGGKV